MSNCLLQKNSLDTGFRRRCVDYWRCPFRHVIDLRGIELHASNFETKIVGDHGINGLSAWMPESLINGKQFYPRIGQRCSTVHCQLPDRAGVNASGIVSSVWGEHLFLADRAVERFLAAAAQRLASNLQATAVWELRRVTVRIKKPPASAFE